MADQESVIKKIKDLKASLGKRVVILTHHYQRKEIVDLGDFRGDSFGLSQKAASDADAEYIVFCGVHFMAESAAILARPHQTVQIPDMNAGCWMADMIDAHLVETAWTELSQIVGQESVMPLVYMNSDAQIKAHCGKHGGAVCTSSNTNRAFEWAFQNRAKIFFFPDEHLGRNTAASMGIPMDEIIVWDSEKTLGGNTEEQIKSAHVILWQGHCLVHTRFTTDHIEDARSKYPGALVVVHPECTLPVVNSADAVGSTSFIVDYVKKTQPGTTILVGTEINLIERLVSEYPDKTILPLHRSLCPNMYKINPENLLTTLKAIGERNIVTVEEEIQKDARLALDRMLSLP